MKRPEMILFDAGKTLIDYRPKASNESMSYLATVDSTEILMEHVTANPHHYDAETVAARSNELFEKYHDCRKALYEISDQVILKTLFELLEMKFSISIEEIERIIWNSSADIVPVDGTAALLDELNGMGIRTAVISNLDFSGHLLEERLNELLPNNRFEFVIASSDYGVRKPQPLLFEIGLCKSGLQPQDVWYVGDKYSVDVLGSAAVGMTPVLLGVRENIPDDAPERMITVTDYGQLTELLKKLSPKEPFQ